MEKNDLMLLNHTKENLRRGKSSSFLDRRELSILIPYFNKEKILYQIYEPFENADKVILYSENLPEVVFFQIESKGILTNPSILGSLFSLHIDRHTFGDIIEIEGNFYFLCLKRLSSYLENHLVMIGKNRVILKERPLDILQNFHRKYDEVTFIVSSERLDAILCRITHVSRKNVLDFFSKKEVLLNYNVASNSSYLLKEGDVFSVRRYGKYRYIGTKGNTKSGKRIIQIEKYK